MSEAPLLEVSDLDISYASSAGEVAACRGVSFTLERAQTLGIVGESGSGKSTLAAAIAGLLARQATITAGSIRLRGTELVGASARTWDEVRGRRIGFVPQDPMSSLNPVWRIGWQVEEALLWHGSGARARTEAIAALEAAGLADAARQARRFPHEFSGGMRQRALIAIGLAASPDLLIADEPTSALDVVVQRRILDTLGERTAQLGTATLLVTHDIALAAERCSRILVMNRGRIVEQGPAADIVAAPEHPYTRRLLASVPSISSSRLRVGPAPQARTTGSSAIEVTNVTRVFRSRGRGGDVTALDDVSLRLEYGRTLALVGGSGSGKSTLASLILGLDRPDSGSVRVHGVDVATLRGRRRKQWRQQIQAVFQNPYGSLDPRYTIARSIAEPLDIHRRGTRRERAKRVNELLELVALPPSVATRYPAELSGGQRQRVAIARALALKPDIVVLDEAVSALDVVVQDQVLALLSQLQSKLGLTYLFITHDLALVRENADDVAVLEAGRIVEAGGVDEVFAAPKAEATRALLEAVPGASLLPPRRAFAAAHVS